MEPFYRIIPDADEAIPTLILTRKTGRIPRGKYGFVEYYCTDPDCDCRRVLLIVFNEKVKQKAVISFGFDQQGPMAGPYLDTANDQSPYAAELLEFFVQSLNRDPEWLDRLYRQYRQVREVVNGGPYRGKPFPKPGKLFYQVMQPPDLEAEIEQSLKQLRGCSRGSASTPKTVKRGRTAPPGFAEEAAPGERRSAGAAPKGMAYFIECYAKAGTTGPIGDLLALQNELQHYLFGNSGAGEELASLLPAICQQSPEDDEKIEAGLRLLYDTLEFFRIELEDRRPGAKQQMERLQKALARRIYFENEDLDLCAAVSNTLLYSGVEVLPVLREANSKVMAAGAARLDLHELPGEEIMAGITRSIESMGLSSPFEGVQAMLELFALNEPELQTALIAEMLDAENPTLREMSALMLFSPDPEVRLGVSQLLAAGEGRNITPDTLRRLIVSRNWFPEEIRRNIDQAITSARRARVECAPLAKSPAMTVHASPVDGSGAQSFQVVVRDGKSHYSCSLLLKQGVGVADAFVISFKSKREHADFLALLSREAFFLSSSPEYLDQRICQALADGIRQGHPPNYWLVRIAELLGSDRWNATPLDAAGQLGQFRKELASGHPTLLSEREYFASLEESAGWHDFEPIFSSWFEDDDSIHREIEASRGNRKAITAAAAVERILTVVLEQRRDAWLERLLFDALWLKSSKKGPFAWHRLFHVASAVADRNIPLREIPLMLRIAQLTFEVYLERKKSGRQKFAAVR